MHESGYRKNGLYFCPQQTVIPLLQFSSRSQGQWVIPTRLTGFFSRILADNRIPLVSNSLQWLSPQNLLLLLVFMRVLPGQVKVLSLGKLVIV